MTLLSHCPPPLFSVARTMCVQAPSLDLSSLRFGAQFTAHMLQIPWTRDHGWGAPVIAPVGPILMHPAAQVGTTRHRLRLAWKGAWLLPFLSLCSYWQLQASVELV